MKKLPFPGQFFLYITIAYHYTIITRPWNDRENAKYNIRLRLLYNKKVKIPNKLQMKNQKICKIFDGMELIISTEIRTQQPTQYGAKNKW
jgi:hypothetical protein